MDPVRSFMDAGVARVILSAPESGNALTTPMLEGLARALALAESDPTCRVIVLSAEGNHFCQGLDLAAAFASGGRPDGHFLRLSVDCLLKIRSARVPVIARVEGDVSGGGVGLVAACDVVIAAPAATFMLPEVVVGMIPAVIAPFLLRRLTPARLRYMALSSRGVRGAEARELGLVDEVVEDETDRAVDRQIQRFFRSSPRALSECKRYFDALTPGDLEAQATAAIDRLSTWLGDPEVVAGARAFSEGEVPPWFEKYRRRSDA
ncbi:enoyl-CoA hydratase/isomerase family protein [Polyangium aurulentum]|uniref:enoyl-CoA hydratase/isomerase family protein n=1 Tax=Polyangium aurulentum TaxID=2567896 RepID=UPI0010AE5785|nr:enoyl-CoA hydratase/isomerase family protein [Polyangium aurulentum]UQA57017.1 enoyl-CoA hydratase/isomerase family protein [Polyangium aurulentum]